jgi:hypothetical protein
MNRLGEKRWLENAMSDAWRLRECYISARTAKGISGGYT